jgi:cytidyltransferase-like protein
MFSTSRIEHRLGPAAFDRPEADLLRALHRTVPFARAYVGGTFDLPHRGHLALLARVRRFARTVVLSLNDDAFAAAYKRPPMMPLADRLAIWRSCRLVDAVTVNVGGADSRPAILASGADCIVHGDDWQGESLMRQMGFDEAWLREHGLSLVILPYTPFVSTTQLLDGAMGRAG